MKALTAEAAIFHIESPASDGLGFLGQGGSWMLRPPQKVLLLCPVLFEFQFLAARSYGC